jgi:peptidoglycan/LPS O-acetylase OafA/YrhL
MTSGSTTQLAPLTSLRFFAASAIVVNHMQGLWGIPENLTEHLWGRTNLSQAVSFFFVLSGFILTYVHPELPTRESRKRFLLARFARIWPAHVATFALLLVLIGDRGRVSGDIRDGWLWLLNLSMLHGWIPLENVYFSFNHVSWTISTEFFFYLLFPLLIWRFRTTWWWKLSLAFGSLAGCAWLCEALGLPEDSKDGWVLTSSAMVHANPLARIPEFVLGMCAALALGRARERLRARLRLGTAVELAAVALMGLSSYLGGSLAHTAVASGWIGRPLEIWLLRGGASCPSFALVILVFGCQCGWLARLLSLRIFVLLGEISYSIYLVHQILLRWYRWERDAFLGIAEWLQLGAFVAVLLVLSYLIWSMIERPARARIVGLWPAHGGARVARGRHAE